MDFLLVGNIIMCVAAFAGFGYGAAEFFKPRKALYGKMIACALLCIGIGRLFNIVRLLAGSDLYENFQLGSLGIIGSIVFFFSANYGAINIIADDGSGSLKKYKAVAHITAIVILCTYIPLFYLGDITLLWKIQGGVLVAAVAACSYYHVKFSIIPDVDLGVIGILRPYNICALLYM